MQWVQRCRASSTCLNKLYPHVEDNDDVPAFDSFMAWCYRKGSGKKQICACANLRMLQHAMAGVSIRVRDRVKISNKG